jgi:hypothetical protein
MLREKVKDDVSPLKVDFSPVEDLIDSQVHMQ